MSETEDLKKRIKELEEQVGEKIDYKSYCREHPLDPRCIKKIDFSEDGKAHLLIDMEHVDRHTMACLMESKGVVFDAAGDSGVSGKRISKKEESEEKGCGCERKG